MAIDPQAFVKEAQQFQKNLEEAAKHTKDVQDGKCTPEEEKEEPAFKLYNSIAESTVKILQNDVVQKGLMEIGEKLGPEVMSAMVQILTISMTYSAHEAVVFYDELLKQELQRNFNQMGEALNATNALVRAHDAMIKIHQKKIQELENDKHKEGAGA